MFSQSKSQIYKAQLRGLLKETDYNCLATFNYAEYFDNSRSPFGAISILNDETFGPKKSLRYVVHEPSTILLIPLVGSVYCNYKNAESEYINVEEIAVIKTEAKQYFELQNTYDDALINFLQIRLKKTDGIDSSFEKKSFKLNPNGVLNTIYQSKHFKVSIGQFDSRQEGQLELNSSEKGLFCFVINGCFEFQNRLIESRDGLTIWNDPKIEWEALSENAIILTVETYI